MKFKPGNCVLEHLESYSDERGTIYSMSELVPFQSVLKITSKKDSLRASHYHKYDYHLCILTKGRMHYYERPVGSTLAPKKILINEGEAFFTGPMTEHLMEFLEDSEFWCLSKLSRKQFDYEEDTVRLNFDLRNLC